MLRQIKLLAKLRLVNFFGINEARYGKKPRRRLKLVGFALLYAYLALVLMGMVALMCYGLAALGAGEKIPLCLAVSSGMVVLMFTVLRAGPTLFDLKDYEILSALPLKPAAIIVSRFLTMYLSNAAMTLGVLLPGAIVCGAMLRPGLMYYPMLLLGALLLPLIPMTVAMLLGMLVYMLSARMKRKNLAVMLLSVLALAVVMLLPIWLERQQPERLILGLQTLLDGMRGFYPPAGWFADAVVEGNILKYLAFALGSAAFFGVAAWLVGRRYASICALLGSHRSRRSFRMTAQESRGALYALYRRELKRFAASPIYMLNCGMGYVLAVILSGVMLFSGAGSILNLPIPTQLLPRMIVFVLAFCYTLSPTTCCSISLEGRHWWLAKSLPVSNREILGSKLLVNLSLVLPAWVLSSALLCICMKPVGSVMLWLLLLPLAYALFASVLGLRINLRMPNFKWENEAVPVKQGKALLLTMLSGMAASILPAVGMAALPEKWHDPMSALLLVLLVGGAAILCCSCLRVDLRQVE